MAVRIRVEIEGRSKSVETSALANTGFEFDFPITLLPLRIAEKLGFDLTELREERWLGGGGIEITVYPLRERVRVWVACEDRKEGPSESLAAVSIGEREVVLNDFILSQLKIAIEDPAKGVWRFRDENKLRESVARVEW